MPTGHCCCSPHFIDEESEAQRGELTHLYHLMRRQSQNSKLGRQATGPMFLPLHCVKAVRVKEGNQCDLQRLTKWISPGDLASRTGNGLEPRWLEARACSWSTWLQLLKGWLAAPSFGVSWEHVSPGRSTQSQVHPNPLNQNVHFNKVPRELLAH